MHFLAVLIELPLQFGSDLRRRAAFVYLKHTFGKGQTVHSACIDSPSRLRMCHSGVFMGKPWNGEVIPRKPVGRDTGSARVAVNVLGYFTRLIRLSAIH
jgi:hypothetical protein